MKQPPERAVRVPEERGEANPGQASDVVLFFIFLFLIVIDLLSFFSVLFDVISFEEKFVREKSDKFAVSRFFVGGVYFYSEK